MTDIEAKGNVIIINQNTTAKSDFASYNFKNKFIILKVILNQLFQKNLNYCLKNLFLLMI